MSEHLKYFIDARTLLILASNLPEKRGLIDRMIEISERGTQFVTSMRSLEDVTALFIKKGEGAALRSYLATVEQICQEYIRTNTEDYDLALQIVDSGRVPFRAALDAAICINRRIHLFSDSPWFDHISGLLRYPTI